MKTGTRILIGSLGLGAALWVGDAAVGSLVFSRGPFLNELVLEVSPHEIYVRSAVLLAFAALGLGSYFWAEREREARESLRESERRFQAFMDNLPGIAFLRDSLGNYLFVNRGWCKATGRGAEEALGKPVHALLPAAEAAEIEEEDRQVLHGKVLEWERYALRGAGGETHWLASKFAVPDSQGRPSLVGGISVDVTEQVVAERRLAEMEELYRTLVENLGEGVAIVDEEEVFVFANPAADAIFGVPKGGLAGHNLREFVTREEFESAQERTRQRREGLTGTHEYRITRPGGEPRILSVTASPRWMPGGGFLGSLAVISDVTELRLSEQALRDSERRYRTILEEMEEGYYEVDLQGNLTFVNAGFCAIVGRAPEEILGQSYHQLMDPVQAERTYRFFNEVFRTGRAAKAVDWEMIRKDGTRVAIEASVSPLRLSQTRWSGFHGVMRDVTDRRAAEAERARARSLETVAKLSEGVAHEVRNPLFAIQVNLAALAQSGALGPPGAAHMDYVVRHMRRLDELVRSLLELGQAAQPGEWVVADLREIVQAACVQAGDQSPTLRERIDIQECAEPALVRAEARRIAQAFVHLLRNADQASPAGGRIRIACASGEDFHIVSISDEGPGISSKVRETLFDPFVTTRTGQPGLGLALARHYVESHGGAITAADNDPPPGATFTVRLPSSPKAVGGER